MKARVVVSLAAFLSAAVVRSQTLIDPNLQVETLMSGPNGLTTMAFLGQGDILVLEKNSGNVRRAINGSLQPGPVLDVGVDSASDRGLSGIAVHPDFPSTPFVYLYYTESGTRNDSSGFADPVGNRVYRSAC